jgi:hypothetical protein
MRLPKPGLNPSKSRQQSPMKHFLIIPILGALCSVCPAQNRSVELDVANKIGRYVLHDLNQDGWCDLWSTLFKQSHDGGITIDDIKNDPDGDADGDGISNYEEMLAFRNPYVAEVPSRPWTAEQAKAARLSALQKSREGDAKTLARFHALLEDRGVLVRPVPNVLEENEQSDPIEGGPDGAGSGSFYHPGDDWSQLMLCSTGGGPEVLFSERLSTGEYLLAWDGADDRVYNVEWSNDLVTWQQGGGQIPMIGGIGTWGQFSPGPARFYRVSEAEDFVTLPSDPSGGNGTTTFGDTLALVMSGGVPSLYLVTVNLPAGVFATAVELLVNGEVHTQCDPTGANYVFIGRVEPWRLREGSHTVHAVAHAISETTAVYQQAVSGGIIRSSTTTFTLERWHEAVGFRASEKIIAPGDPVPHDIYNPCKANDTLPFGPDLRVLCGYKSQIWLEAGMGKHLSEGLIHKVANDDYRDGTVVNAWGHVWNKSSNRDKGNIARAVYWPECEHDRIHGAKPASHIPPLQAHASQAELKETDFIP